MWKSAMNQYKYGYLDVLDVLDPFPVWPSVEKLDGSPGTQLVLRQTPYGELAVGRKISLCSAFSIARLDSQPVSAVVPVLVLGGHGM